MIPAEERRSYERGREGRLNSCPQLRSESRRRWTSVPAPPARLPRVELPRGMRISIVLRQKGKVRLHAQPPGDNACLPLQVPFK